MSKKSFVVLGLSLNVILCMVIAGLYFSGIGTGKKTEEAIGTTEQISMESSTELLIQPPTETTTEATTEATTEPPVQPPTEATTEATTETTTEATTEPPVQPPVEPSTEPVSTGNIPAYVAGMTVVEVHNSCNVRSTPEVSAPVVGTTKAGEKYPVIPELCDEHWLAISFQGTTGYMSNDFGTLLP